MQSFIHIHARVSIHIFMQGRSSCCFEGFFSFQGFAQNFSSNYSVQLRAFLMSPELQKNLANFFVDPDGGGGALLEAAAIRLNISSLNLTEWQLRLQNYFGGNFRLVYTQKFS